MRRKRSNSIEELTVEQYAALEDKSIVDVILSHVKPLKTLKTRICDIEPRKPSLSDFTLREVIWFKNKFQAGEIEEVMHHVYGIKTTETANVYSVASSLKWLESEMLRINENEKRLSSDKDGEAWKQAGIETLGGFGEYVSVFFLSKDLTKEDAILDMPYYRVFDYQEMSKTWAEIEFKFNKIKQQQS